MYPNNNLFEGMVACLKTAIKIGCVAFGTLAFVAGTAYFVRRRKRKNFVIKINSEAAYKLSPKTAPLGSEEFVQKLKERKSKKSV